MVKNLPANAGGQETRVQSLSQEETLKQEIDPTPVFLPGKFHGQGSLEGYRPWGCKRVRQDLKSKQQQTGYTNHCPNYFLCIICFRPPFKKTF